MTERVILCARRNPRRQPAEGRFLAQVRQKRWGGGGIYRKGTYYIIVFICHVSNYNPSFGFGKRRSLNISAANILLHKIFARTVETIVICASGLKCPRPKHPKPKPRTKQF